MTPVQLEALKTIPQVQSLLESESGAALATEFSRKTLLKAIRRALDNLRDDIKKGTTPSFEEASFFNQVRARLIEDSAPNLRPVINATGIVLHTNLGRAPLAQEAIDAIAHVSRGYSNLEMDLDSGERGSRYAHVESLLTELTQAEAALVVNNNAAAVLLALNTFAAEGDVIVSRGELIEIGGSFRIPEVIERGGARLVEVGATNKTHAEDYKRAISESTRVLLKVHPSNYRVVGFTSSVDRGDIVALAHEHELVAIEDLGSGTLVEPQSFGLAHETTVADCVDSGMDVVTFIGDKLLGGPQAGILVGKEKAIARMKKNPLLRALRIDKLSVAALEATLRIYRDGNVAETLPLWAMLSQDEAAIAAKAQDLAKRLAAVDGLELEIQDGHSYAGGGSLPDEQVPTKLVCVRCSALSAEALSAALRTGTPAIVGRIVNDAFVMDVRTIHEQELDGIVSRFEEICA